MNKNTFALNAFLNTVRVVPGLTSDPHDQLTIGLSTDTCSLDDCRTGWRWEDGTDLTDSNFEFWGEGQPIKQSTKTVALFDILYPKRSNLFRMWRNGVPNYERAFMCEFESCG